MTCIWAILKRCVENGLFFLKWTKMIFLHTNLGIFSYFLILNKRKKLEELLNLNMII